MFDGQRSGAISWRGSSAGPSQLLPAQSQAGSTVEVLGFVKPSCFHEIALRRELSPRHSPSASSGCCTRSGVRDAGHLHRHRWLEARRSARSRCIGPDRWSNLAALFTWKKSGNTSGKPFAPTSSTRFRAKAGHQVPAGLHPHLARGDRQSRASTSDVCNNWAYTNANGVAQFPAAYLNKAGWVHHHREERRRVLVEAGSLITAELRIGSPWLLGDLAAHQREERRIERRPSCCPTFVPQFVTAGDQLRRHPGTERI